jgi:hypothetical protein
VIFCPQDFLASIRIAIAFFVVTKGELSKMNEGMNDGMEALKRRWSTNVYFRSMRRSAQNISNNCNAFWISSSEVYCTNLSFFL